MPHLWGVLRLRLDDRVDLSLMFPTTDGSPDPVTWLDRVSIPVLDLGWHL
jgi:hypothetical protein